ncbi:diacylglycerol/lipid kinase family protein [Agrococcus sp. SGAir0287]|uniref:diacylglycerol/lipid kinase family protein n=1 Tax=Agrococcus sp. SGAir0287 TaxID=2070347 RepID=UPI001586EAB5|nr:diacylglycerol kinase family protein [Agrococcus sp. SGAir0287]
MPVVIANPIARASMRGVRALEAHGARDVRWTGERRATEHAQDALAEGADAVVVVGGDGTIRDVADVLAGTSVPMGVVPAGTANLFARNLDLPLRSADAAARIALGLDAAALPTDLGRVVLHAEGRDAAAHAFLVVVGIGHDATAVEAASLARKRRLGWGAYVLSGVRRFAAPLHAVRARLDDEPPMRTQAWTVLVHNTARITLGLRVVPGTRPDDGLLHLAAVSPRRILHWGRIAASGMGLARAEGVLSHRTGHRVRLEADRIPVQVDGDALGRIVALEAWIDPGALLVRRPGGER